jgi:hypothetical protein
MLSLKHTVVGFILGGLCPDLLAGNPYPELVQQLAGVHFRSWQIAASHTTASAYDLHDRIRVIGGGGSRAMAESRQKALQEYLSKLVPAMQPSTNVAHIPQEYPVAVEPEQNWTHHYALARNSVRPRIQYKWSSNATGKADTFALTDEYIDVWRANFDVFMWYRDELEQKSADENHIGGKRFKLFLDHIVADLLKGLPSAPEIDMSTGTISAPAWNLILLPLHKTVRTQRVPRPRIIPLIHQQPRALCSWLLLSVSGSCCERREAVRDVQVVYWSFANW